MRRLALLLLILALAPGTWLRDRIPPPDYRLALRFAALNTPSEAELAAHLGPFRLEHVWRLESPHENFGGFSSLVALGDGQLLSASDRGYLLRFAPPGSSDAPPELTSLFPEKVHAKASRDVEALTRDPGTGTLWMAMEGYNLIARDTGGQGFSEVVSPPAMRGWGVNSGPEAFLRLDGGRFVVLAEEFTGRFEDRNHRGVLFAADPIEDGAAAVRFTFAGPQGFSPTDMAQLPDGRVLILMRKLVWPLPARFAGRLVLADPAAIEEGGFWRGETVARLTSSLPVDNFEGIAIERSGGQDRRLTVWLISDDNGSAFQATLLWKLSLDPADLPDASKKARGSSARPSSGSKGTEDAFRQPPSGA